MAQRPTSDFDIDPNITSGTDLANILNRFQDAIDSGNSGASRPAYLAAGGMWVKEGNPMRLYLYDGTKDIELYNTTDGFVGASQWKDNGNDIYYDSGNVVINKKLTVGDGNNTESSQISMAGPANSTATFMGGRKSIGFKFSNPDGDLMYINADGRVGIGGQPSRSAEEIAKEAKDTLAGWKSTFDERIKAEPKADKKAATLEITGEEFDTFPTEKALVERLTERNIGGGTAKLQVAGDGWFSGTVYANGSPLARAADLIETLSTLREATRDETTIEGLRDALSDAIGGLIQKFEAQISTTES